jgi:Xaa-Pro aminopeptidase
MAGAAWSLEELSGRWKKLQAEMAKTGLDGIMLGEKSNYVYATGHESTQFLHRMRPQLFLLPREGDPVLYVYNSEHGKLKHLTPRATLKGYVDVPFPVEGLAEAVNSLGWAGKTIGAELGPNQRLGLPVNDYLALQKAIPSITWVDCGPTIMAVQDVKTAGELDALRTACKISEKTWDIMLGRVKPGVTTAEINQMMSILSIELGADATEPFSAHVTHLSATGATDGVLREGDMLKCDFHTRYRGYWSDLCRLAAVGEPTASHVEWHATQYKLLMDTIGSIKPGLRARDIAAFGNAGMEKIGQQPLHPIKRMGHGIGLEATSPPSLNMYDETILVPGMTIAVEPRIITDIGSLLLEESVVVTETGYELLTTGAGTLGVIR